MSEGEDLIQQLADRIESNRKEIQEGLGEKKDQFIEMVKSFLSNMKPEDAIIYAGLAYLGYDNLPFRSDMVKVLWGPVGLKLATTSAEGSFGVSIKGIEIPVNSQVAGLSMLAALGFSCLPWEALQDKIRKEIEDTRSAYALFSDALDSYRSVMTEDEHNTLQELARDVLRAINGYGSIEDANASLRGYIEGMIPTWEGRLEDG